MTWLWWLLGGIAFVVLGFVGRALTPNSNPPRLGPHGDRNDYGERHRLG